MPRIVNHNGDLQGFPCGLDSCDAVFGRRADKDRHQRKHQPYTKRPFKCDFCEFRANQKSGLKCHENSVHLKKRIPCRHPGCDRDFSDPSTLSRHTSRRHKLSSKKRSLPAWIDFTSTFTASKASAPSPDLRKISVSGDQVERRSPDESSANVTLHTSPVGRQEGSSCQNLLLDPALFSFSPSPILSPLLEPGAPYQPDWYFQSSPLYPSGSGLDFPSCSYAVLPGLSLPQTNLTTDMPPCGFQVGVGMPNAYSTANPAQRFVDPYFSTLLEIPVNDFPAQSSTNSSFAMSTNTMPYGPSLMVPPPMANYDSTCSGSDSFFCGASQRWEVDTPALTFEYDALGTEYYSSFNSLTF